MKHYRQTQRVVCVDFWRGCSCHPSRSSAPRLPRQPAQLAGPEQGRSREWRRRLSSGRDSSRDEAPTRQWRRRRAKSLAPRCITIPLHHVAPLRLVVGWREVEVRRRWCPRSVGKPRLQALALSGLRACESALASTLLRAQTLPPERLA